MKDVFSSDKIKNVRGNRATELLEHISALFTKEEVIAIFTEIQLEIEDRKTDYDKDSKAEHDIYYAYDKCSRIIQQKINAIEGGEDAGE